MYRKRHKIPPPGDTYRRVMLENVFAYSVGSCLTLRILTCSLPSPSNLTAVRLQYWCTCRGLSISTRRHPPTMVLVWRLLVGMFLLAAYTAVVEAFTFKAPNPGARATSPSHTLRRFTGAARGAVVGPAFPCRGVAGREAWARSARRAEDEENDKIDVLTGSGLRGVDTSKLTGNDKRDADWFQRTAEREASGQLQWFEDPAVYIGLCLLVPVVILVWGVLNCYIPGFCASTF